jgi:hypothetical protein
MRATSIVYFSAFLLQNSAARANMCGGNVTVSPGL